MTASRRHVLTAVAAWALAGCGPAKPPRDASPYPHPVQHERNLPANIAAHGGFTLRPRAWYRIEALVMSVSHYRLDALAKLSPMDFALAWEEAATPRVQAGLSVSQSGRWFHWRTRDEQLYAHMRKAGIVHQMANVHMVPADEVVAATLRTVRKGDSVLLEGLLVDIDHADPALRRKTSLTRKDSAGGSCEILYVRSAQVWSTVPQSASAPSSA